MGDVEYLGHHHQLGGLEFVATELGDGARQGIALVGILVLDDRDRDAVDEEDDVGAVAFAAGRSGSPLIGDVETVVLGMREVDDRHVAMAFFTIVVDGAATA